MTKRSLAGSTLVVLWSVYACSGSGTETAPEDDVVLTGVGGGTTTASTGGPATSAPASSASSGGAGGSGTGGAGGSCDDAVFHEPNNSEDAAFKLKSMPITECDGDGDSISGTIAGVEEDWFFYEGDNDATFCVIDPARTLTQSEGGIEICKYFECKSGIANTDLSCPGGTTTTSSPNGRPGCCAGQGFTVGDVQCSGSIDDDMYVYIRLHQPSATAGTCNAYTLTYHF